MNAVRPPAAIAIRSPSSQEPVVAEPQMPKNAPINIIPSRAMFTTPLRSDIKPPRAPYVSGVA